jgi:trehalose-6-phosphatase
VDIPAACGGVSDSSTGSHAWSNAHFDFVLCIGDDRTDEVMFGRNI